MSVARICLCHLYKATRLLNGEHWDSPTSQPKWLTASGMLGNPPALRGPSQILGVSTHAHRSPPARSDDPQLAEMSGKEMVGQGKRQPQMQGPAWGGQQRRWGIGMGDREGGLAAGPETDHLFRFSPALQLPNLYRTSKPRPQGRPHGCETGSEITRMDLAFCPSLGKSLTSILSFDSAKLSTVPCICHGFFCLHSYSFYSCDHSWPWQVEGVINSQVTWQQATSRVGGNL